MSDSSLNKPPVSVMGLGKENNRSGYFKVLDVDGGSVSPLAPLTDEPILEAQQHDILVQQRYLAEVSADISAAEVEEATLESIGITLENILANNNTSVMSFEMMDITINSIYTKYGIDTKTVMPSLEDFTKEPEVQTQISLEKIKGSVGAIIESIGQMLKKLWFKTKEFMNNLFKYGRSLTRRAQALNTHAINNERDDVTTIKLFSATKLSVDGAVPKKTELLRLYAKASPNFDKITDIISIQIKSISDMVDGLVNGNMEGPDKVLLNTVAKLKSAQMLFNTTLVFQGARVVDNPIKVNGMNKVYPMPKLVLNSKDMDERDDNSTVYQIESLTSKEVQDITRSVIDSVAALDKVKRTYQSKDVDRYINVLTDYEYKLRDKKDKHSISVKNGHRVIAKALRLLLAFNNKYINYMMSIHKAILDYCSQSAQPKTLTANDNKADDNE